MDFYLFYGLGKDISFLKWFLQDWLNFIDKNWYGESSEDQKKCNRFVI